MIVYKLNNENQMSFMAADMVCAQVISKPTSVIGLATGTTPLGLYREMYQRYTEQNVDFSQTVSFNLDEYCGLPRNHEQSYYTFMMDNLFSKINIRPENIHVPYGMADDIDAECEAYEKSINDQGGIDIQILGIGRNGHIGFNEPGSVFIDKTHQITLTEDTRDANGRFFDNDATLVPTQAISMGIGTIMRARQIVLLGSQGKQGVIEQMLHGDIDPQKPASMLHLHPNVTILYLED